MNATLCMKDIYPIALFITLLVTWGLVGSSTTADATAPFPQNQPAISAQATELPQNLRWSYPTDSFCESMQEISKISPAFSTGGSEQHLLPSEKSISNSKQL
jgi:hypothetical protein